MAWGVTKYSGRRMPRIQGQRGGQAMRGIPTYEDLAGPEPSADLFNRLVLDDGQAFDARQVSPHGLKSVGVEQNRLRREQVSQEDFDYNYGAERGFGPGRSLSPLPDASTDALFGLLQAKENAANVAGKRFRVNPNAATENPTRMTADPYQMSTADDTGLWNTNLDATARQSMWRDKALKGLKSGIRRRGLR